MYIEPNTNIKLLKFNGLDNTYKNTIYFADRTTQYNYFNSKAKYSLTNYTYQRVRKGVARVGINAENLYDCNYMMFQNASFGSRWFYAFITSVEYVNNVTSEITFEIDDFQTWFLDCTVRSSFVVREHVTDDTIGANTIPENLELGEYTAGWSSTFPMDDYKIVVVASVTTDSSGETKPTSGALYGGIYSQCEMRAFSSPANANAYVESVVEAGGQGGIITVFYMPEIFVAEEGSSTPKRYNSSYDKRYTLDGYTPKNNKLKTYPYNYLYITNNEGTGGIFPWEDFTDTRATFVIAGAYCPTPSVIMYPTNFKGVDENIDASISIGGFPQCPWNTDSYKNWLANSKFDLIRTGATAVGDVLTGNVGGAVNSVLDIMSETYRASIQPPQAHGYSADMAQVALNIKHFTCEARSVKYDTARAIDSYFDMFGYAVRRTKVPNINTRPYWNYVETRDCNIVGSVPADSLKAMKQAFNNGITFWSSGDNIGNYSLNNH